MSKVKQGQSFLDKVTQLTGSYENALEMALLNNVSVTDDAVLKTEYKASTITKTGVVSFFKSHDEPATAISVAQQEESDDFGIGEMEIGSTFIVR
ncbi:hypothetical protein [Wenyingzhuangia aestuarii]|uniref:hypothetical protein n=1 Tax=Wenyingzhuangia aestuarii TaxID=1647582 RepID=UPI00143A5443|nr:hypothetical protein [Wenyingzhuangia aestuarii]NJB83610.1 hypothetical protein [Wenyingzhuangia aestuarii]